MGAKRWKCADDKKKKEKREIDKDNYERRRQAGRQARQGRQVGNRPVVPTHLHIPKYLSECDFAV